MNFSNDPLTYPLDSRPSSGKALMNFGFVHPGEFRGSVKNRVRTLPTWEGAGNCRRGIISGEFKI